MSKLCKKRYLQFYRLYNFPSFRSSYWRSSIRNSFLRNFTKLTETCDKVSFLIKLQAKGTIFYLSHVFSWRFLVYFISTKDWNGEREIPWCSSNIYIFASVWSCFTLRFEKKFYGWWFDQKMCLKGFDVPIFMVRGTALGNCFWMVNIWQAPLQKWLKRSILNSAHTFLTDSCTKLCPCFY